MRMGAASQSRKEKRWGVQGLFYGRSTSKRRRCSLAMVHGRERDRFTDLPPPMSQSRPVTRAVQSHSRFGPLARMSYSALSVKAAHIYRRS